MKTQVAQDSKYLTLPHCNSIFFPCLKVDTGPFFFSVKFSCLLFLLNSSFPISHFEKSIHTTFYTTLISVIFLPNQPRHRQEQWKQSHLSWQVIAGQVTTYPLLQLHPPTQHLSPHSAGRMTYHVCPFYFLKIVVKCTYLTYIYWLSSLLLVFFWVKLIFCFFFFFF